MFMKFRFPRGVVVLVAALVLATLLIGCLSNHATPGTPAPRAGDEISVCGQLFHTGTRVVLWTDPRGYNGYSVYKRYGPWPLASWEATTNPAAFAADAGAVNPATLPAIPPKWWTPNRYSYRTEGLSPEQIEQIRGGWTLPALQKKVDQFVIHYDDAGLSRTCFLILQDKRDLSVHFMLDLDGTIYQTLDLQERARHATISNDRSVGIEIANMGAYSTRESLAVLKEWYHRDSDGRIRITIPARYGDGGILTPNFVGHPMRNRLIVGEVQGRMLRQYDYTPQQYRALIHLTAALCRIFPRIRCDYPHDAHGKLINHVLSHEQWENFHGVLGHYHIQLDKSDPGPAFQWNYVIDNARKLMRGGTLDQ
jgi:N-acetyl-anhydromuramyl-L-alanine amidase AmpD